MVSYTDEQIERIEWLTAQNAQLTKTIAQLKKELEELKVLWVRKCVRNALADARSYHASVLTKSCRVCVSQA